MRANSYLQATITILQAYNGTLPFAIWLKNYFREHKKFGSRDRKIVSHLCFCYFRLGGAFQQVAIQDRILTGLFLCQVEHHSILADLKPEWNAQVSDTTEQKLIFLMASEQLYKIFPFTSHLSRDIDLILFSKSFLAQPDVFLRLRPNRREMVFKILAANSVSYQPVYDDCVRIPQQTKIEDLFQPNKEVVVQDMNSQQVLHLLPEKTIVKTVWDCCAASGGKSILAFDRLPGIKLTVSDVRSSIIANLKKRFQEAGIKDYRAFVADVSNISLRMPVAEFDLVICDAPCTGSGTWGRTPEQLVFFDESKIAYYSTLQKKISSNALKHVKKEGYFLYITCSVFAAENEEVVAHLLNGSSIQLVASQYFKGYTQKADTLFAALFKA